MNSVDSNPRIRPIRADDDRAIHRILQEATTSAPFAIGPHWTLEQVRKECESGGLALDNASGQILAFIFFRDVGAAFEIIHLATAVGARGQGAMKSLLGELIARQKPVWLEVHEGNVPARRLYESVGFIASGRRANYYADGGAALLYNYG